MQSTGSGAGVQGGENLGCKDDGWKEKKCMGSDLREEGVRDLTYETLMITEILRWSEAWKWPVEGNLSSRFAFINSGNCYRLFLQKKSLVKGAPFTSGLPELQDDAKDGSTPRQRHICLLIGPVLPLNDYFG